MIDTWWTYRVGNMRKKLHVWQKKMHFIEPLGTKENKHKLCIWGKKLKKLFPWKKTVFSRGQGFPGPPAAFNTSEAWGQWDYQWGGEVFCPIHPEELFLVLGEFKRVVGDQQIICLACSKHGLLGSYPENTLAIPLVWFLPQKEKLFSKLWTHDMKSSAVSVV